MPSDAEQNGTIHVSAFDLPRSRFLSPETLAALKRQAEELQSFLKRCPVRYADIASPEDVVVYRECLDKYHFPTLIGRHTRRFKVTVKPLTIGGVATEVFIPVDGISANNRRRVLINLHGGGFIIGARWNGQLESIPVSALGKIRIVSVDYRMAPEHRFPAASEDIAAVYNALLAEYKPENIGIYGCSTGGFLTAESVAWMLKHGLPTPGAVGMFCAGAWPNGGGDSEHLAAAIAGTRSSTSSASFKGIAYFTNEDLKNPLAFPGLAPNVMARFPPSLLITSTRDFLMSSVVVTHTQLNELGVRADLHVWEGLDHAFFYEPDLRESRQVYDVIVRFFDEHLGRRAAR